MVEINLERIREALPKHAKVVIGAKLTDAASRPYIECMVEPGLSPEEFDMCTAWQRDVIGTANIDEVVIEEKGRHWFVFLKRQQMMELVKATTEDIQNFIAIVYAQKNQKRHGR